ncbi:hypothetical protein AVEN_263876-1 [Araneus ventricosus]|uniref:Uncharacterized protein n=1 Tax=Araneus ventricosus TaxID=182803 RepID=A0A4Y2LCP2_ARAVE|nr:hypothetical protein AVEN_263876-1 [Araneus ventricosus]
MKRQNSFDESNPAGSRRIRSDRWESDRIEIGAGLQSLLWGYAEDQLSWAFTRRLAMSFVLIPVFFPPILVEKLGKAFRDVPNGPNDHVFVYFADHGAPGLIAFPGDNAYALDSMYVLVNLCEKGVHPDRIMAATDRVCIHPPTYGIL